MDLFYLNMAVLALAFAIVFYATRNQRTHNR